MFSNGEVQDWEVHIVEGQLLTITCAVSANPSVSPGNIRWRKGQEDIGSGGTYKLSPVDRNDAGDYSCTATHQQQASGQDTPVTRSTTEPFRLVVYCE